ncbi:MAG: dihydroorotate dehydrogenase [Candidatus Omnitrophica bacterium]|nr:dihydroorotate dehydrogenase [Candidatus Omnitrophota bacterium]
MNVQVTIGSLILPNPLTVASGTFGYGVEYGGLINAGTLGAIVTKTITPVPRTGNRPSRLWETPSGLLNSIGLENVGLERFITEKIPPLESYPCPVIVSIMGETEEGFARLTERLDGCGRVDGLELNLSCPNIAYHGGGLIAQDPEAVGAVVAAVRKKTKKAVIAKLTPEVSDISAIGRAAEAAGADAIALINTIKAMAIDVETRRPRLGNVTGGLSGPAIRPVAVRLVWELFQAVRIPIIGMGGIATCEDALEFIIAGASAIAVGTYIFVDPQAVTAIPDDICDYMKKHRMKDIRELVGSVQVQ